MVRTMLGLFEFFYYDENFLYFVVTANLEANPTVYKILSQWLFISNPFFLSFSGSSRATTGPEGGHGPIRKE